MTKNDRIRVLLIEDNPEDTFLIKEFLSPKAAADASFELEAVEQIQAGLERLKKGGIDVILLDLFLPDSRGFHSFLKVQGQAPGIPIVVMTSLNDESFATETVKQGAQDYLVKGQLNRTLLIRTIRYAIERQRIRRELDRTNARLEQLALNDPLTGLLNRRGLQQVLSLKFPRVSLEDPDCLALLIDLDDFKKINDALGHGVGDVVLKEIANKLKASLRATDYAARIGGNEFMILLPETRLAEGIQVAEKVRLAVSASPIYLASGASVKVTASLGLVPLSPTTPSIDQLLTETHVTLHKSKQAGKNQVTFAARNFDTVRTDISTGISRESPLAGIVSELRRPSQFRSVMQPIFDLPSLAKIGYEFLSRCNLAVFEMPDDFFRVSFENKILTVVDHQCFRTCLAAAAHLSSASVQRHINLFPSTMIDIPTQHLLSEFPKHPDGHYCIEISEQQIIGDPSYLTEPVEAFKKSGIQVAIDDVGFGRSCLESLILLEPHIVKIDKRCINGISRDPARARSLRRILNVAEALNTQVVAEGIESEEDLELLMELGVKFGQGFYLANPVKLEEVVANAL